MKKVLAPPGQRPNPVAKHAQKFNRSVAFEDRTRYTRKAKHKAREPFPVHVADFRRAAEKVCRH